jgi:hypothetical protein
MSAWDEEIKEAMLRLAKITLFVGACVLFIKGFFEEDPAVASVDFLASVDCLMLMIGYKLGFPDDFIDR